MIFSKLLKKYWVEVSTVVLFFATRIINLDIIPIFTDEAIYTYWSQIALHDPAHRYISLVDGKQPLFIWFGAVFQIFIRDPLIATRSVSILSGLVSLFGIYLLTKELFGRKTARFSALLYVILPFTLIYDRLALYDSLLTAICIFIVFFSLKLAASPRLDYALLTGLTIGLGLITKSSAFLYLYLLPIPLIAVNFKKGNIIKHLTSYLPLALLSVILSQIIFNSLRLSPLFYMIDRKNMEFIRPVGVVLQNPFLYFISNSNAMISWLNSYLGFPLIIIFLIALAHGLYKKNKKVILLSIYIAFPFTVEGLFNKVLYPRFMLFYLPLIIVLISHGFSLLYKTSRLKNWALNLVIITSLLYPAVNSVLILTNPPLSKIATSDLDQYINSWPAGYGVREVVQILKIQTQKEQVYIATEGTFGLLPYALNIYFYGLHNPAIIGFWPVDPENLPQEVYDSAKTQKTYFLFNENQKEIKNPRLIQVASFQKGQSQSRMRLFEVR